MNSTEDKVLYWYNKYSSNLRKANQVWNNPDKRDFYLSKANEAEIQLNWKLVNERSF